YDEQPNGAPKRDRGVARDLTEGRAVPRFVHERLAVSGERDERVGRRLGGPRVAQEGRADTQPRAVAGVGRGGASAQGVVALGARPRRTSAERVRERPRRARRERAVVVGRNRRLALRRMAGGGTRKRTSQMKKALVA